ncbi:TIGR00730 family Rossman fold protein [Elongatibacter sediminis]|uniref:Cytokinin riboside 5'-monophosphate phosphoribohydrolase n=1 Tax=Elongatibacter sediminis TaxID=3119006 RepID=A0AAW9RHD6_9GAMM
MKRICVYCGSNPGRRPDYRAAARSLGEELVRRGIGLVYGGASIGVMGAVADAVLEGGGEVIGIIPHALAAREVAHTGLTQLDVVDSMHQRKARMAELSDGFIALPGGWGTLEELFEALTWSQLGLHHKPCGLLNISGYFNHLEAFLEHTMAEQFVRTDYRPMMMMEDEPATLLNRFATYRAPRVHKWIGPGET